MINKTFDNKMFSLIQSMIDNNIIGLYVYGENSNKYSIIWGRSIEPSMLTNGIIVKVEAFISIDGNIGKVEHILNRMSSYELKNKLTMTDTEVTFIKEENGNISFVPLTDVKYRHSYYQWKEFMGDDE